MGKYRGRAVKAQRGQRKLKQATPVVKFTMNKIYQVQAGATVSGNNNYILSINGATPFNPITQENGDWVASEPLIQEPLGLNSDMYRHYKTLTVKGCHVTASVVDNLDAQNVAEDEKICLGQLSIVRSTEPNTIGATEQAIDIKRYYGQKSKNFTLASRTLAVDGLTKSAFCSNGYSAKKTYATSATANDELRVVNQAGSANTPADSTYLNVCLTPRFATNSFLQPMVVSVRVTYIIQFQEPTILQEVPLPMSAEGKKKYNRSSNKKVLYKQATFGGLAAAVAAQMMYMQRRGRPALRYR